MKTFVRHYPVLMSKSAADTGFEAYRPKPSHLDQIAETIEQDAQKLGGSVVSVTPLQGSLVLGSGFWNYNPIGNVVTCGFIVVFESADDCELPDTLPKI